MSDYFKKNKLLLEKHSSAAKELAEGLPPTIRVQSTPTGEDTVWHNDMLIHSMYDPVKEGRAFANKVGPGSQVCLYGFGLGYHIKSLLEKIGPSGFLLVTELNPDLVLAAMTLKDQSAILSDERFHLVFGFNEEKVAAEITDYMGRLQEECKGKLDVLFHPPSFKCIPSTFPRLTNSLEVLLLERRFPAVLGSTEQENYELNIELVRQSPGINELNCEHNGKPGILISAGPSLDDILPYLQQMRGDAVLACVDTTLPIPAREGIHPDYVFSLDPQEISFEYFRENLGSTAKLIFTPTANSKIVHSYQGEKYVVFKEGSKFIDNDSVADKKGSTPAGGSVSCLALDVMIQLGCNPIFLTGQDLSFPSNRNYSRFSNNNEQIMDKVNDKISLKKSHLAKTRESKTISVETNDGREVTTNQAMYSYLRAIEELAAAAPETTIYNLCSHGAQIDHVISLGSVNELIKILVHK